jgi:hypothetical protein
MDGRRREFTLMLSQAQTSRIIAMGIICVFFAFIAGYYLGKKSQSEEFAESLEHHAFADRLSSALYTLYGQPEYNYTEESKGKTYDRNDTQEIR